MNQWLSRRADALADAADVERTLLELDPKEIDLLLDLAGFAAHESGARTNAPLLCYLLGRAQAGGKSLDELGDAVRSTS
jgi:hypothetical protein